MACSAKARRCAASNVPAPTNELNRCGSPEEDVEPVVLFLARKDAQLLAGYSLTSGGGQIIDSARLQLCPISELILH